MCSSSISYMLTAACCGCIGSSKSRYLLCCSRSIPPRPNTLTLLCTLPCQSLRELSWQNFLLIFLNHVFYCVIMFLLCFIVLAVFFSYYYLIKQPNCSLIYINWNAEKNKHDFWTFFKTELSVFANELSLSLCLFLSLSLSIYIYTCIYIYSIYIYIYIYIHTHLHKHFLFCCNFFTFLAFLFFKTCPYTCY